MVVPRLLRPPVAVPHRRARCPPAGQAPRSRGGRVTTRRRVARTSRPCGSCPEYARIQPGDVYLEHTAFPGPGDDAGYATTAGHPVRLAECADCARRFGRGELLQVPA